MNLRQLSAWGQSRSQAKGESDLPPAERCLNLLAKGAAAGVPAIDAEGYRAFRSGMDQLAHRLTEPLPDEDRLALIHTVVREFESYRNGAESALREQLAAWRNAVTSLLSELLADLGVDSASPDAAPLLQMVKRLTTAEEINAWCQKLNLYLHPLNSKGPAYELTERLRMADCSTANDNAAGLRGAGSAVEHLRKMMNDGADGFIVLFRLSCLDVISQRFGPEAVEDCLMAVSAFLIAGLEGEDSIYHWSDSALLAILRGRYSEFMVAAELDRIIAQNRESSINVAGRATMLRIPISFELTPINQLRSADDLLKISALHAAKR
jgi:GGDEF domain-containing protein